MSIVVTYCERVQTGLFAEPLNSLSNFGYLICAGLLFTRWYHQRHKSHDLLVLSFLLALVGIGSASFHSAPSMLTLYLDVIPILCLMLCFCWLIQARLLQHSTLYRIVGLLILLVSTLYLSSFSAVANGSLLYLPTMLMSFCAVLMLGRQANALRLSTAMFLLFAGLVLRTIDQQICDRVPIGTHFLWHLLTALACYFAASAIGKGSHRHQQ